MPPRRSNPPPTPPTTPHTLRPCKNPTKHSSTSPSTVITATTTPPTTTSRRTTIPFTPSENELLTALRAQVPAPSWKETNRLINLVTDSPGTRTVRIIEMYWHRHLKKESLRRKRLALGLEEGDDQEEDEDERDGILWAPVGRREVPEGVVRVLKPREWEEEGERKRDLEAGEVRRGMRVDDARMVFGEAEGEMEVDEEEDDDDDEDEEDDEDMAMMG